MRSDRLAAAAAESQNSKIGDAAATYSAQVSCPDSCPFFAGGGCYAESGAIGSFVTKPLNDYAAQVHADHLDVAVAEAAAIDALDVVAGRPMRLHGVGDCKTDEATRIVAAAARRYAERGGGPVWTYTHAWRTVSRNSWGDVSVLASCETAADVQEARSRGYAPSIVVDEFASKRLYSAGPSESANNKERDARDERTMVRDRPEPIERTVTVEILPCPAQTHGDVTCSSCRLCMNDKALLRRGYAIGFSVHGTTLAVKKAKQALATPDDPRRKLTSRDFINDYLAQHGRWPTNLEVVVGASVVKGSAYEMLKRMKHELEPVGAA